MDLNCDMGESFGTWQLGADLELIPLVTSVNVACGWHGGDPAVMRQTVAVAAQAGVALGAHPGYPDLAGFGRRAMALSPQEVEDAVLYQIGALAAFAHAAGVELRHVKAHGALYNRASQDPVVAAAIVRGIAAFDRRLWVVGLAQSALTAAAEEAGLPTAHEAFLDRRYEPDGSLRDRRLPGAVLGRSEAVAQALQLVQQGTVLTTDGSTLPVRANTLCIHGDTPAAVELAAAVRQTLTAAGVTLRSLLPTAQ